MFIQIVIKGRILELVLCQNLLLNPLLCLFHSSSFYSSSTVTPRTVQYFSETTKRVHTWQLIQILVWVKILQCRRQELSSSITNSRRFIFNTNWILTILIVIRILAWLFTHVLPVLPPSQTHTHVYTPRLTFILSAHLSFLPVIKYRLINVRVTLRSGLPQTSPQTGSFWLFTNLVCKKSMRVTWKMAVRRASYFGRRQWTSS